MKNLDYDYGKVAVALLTIVTGIVLILTGDHTSGIAMVMTVVGYVFGNGRLIAKGENPRPLVRRNNRPEAEPPTTTNTGV